MGSSGRVITTADIRDQSVMPVDMNAGGAADRVLGTVDGVAAGWTTLTAGMAGARALNASSLYGGGQANRVLSSGSAGLDPLWVQIVAAMIATGTITSNEIADGTLTNADINAAASILVSKLFGGGTVARVVGTVDGTNMVMTLVSGAMIQPGTITTTQIADGTIGTIDVASGALCQVSPTAIGPPADQSWTNTSAFQNITNLACTLSGCLAGSVYALLAGVSMTHSVANGRNYLRLFCTTTGGVVGWQSQLVGNPTAGLAYPHFMLALATVPGTGSLTFQVQAGQIDTGAGATTIAQANSGYMAVAELRRGGA